MSEKNSNFINNDDDMLSFGEEFEKEFTLIDEGKYEVVIDKLEKRTSSKGGKYLSLTFTIRKDVKQGFGGRKLFFSIFAQQDDKAYNFDVINKIIVTQKNLPTYKTHFKDIDEVFQYLIGLHLIISVEISFDEVNGKDRNQVVPWSFEPSVWDTQDHSKAEPIQDVPSEDTEEVQETADTNDDGGELPF